MKKINLTAAQHRAYKKLEDGNWHSAYDLQCGLNTLNALKSKGYLISRGEGKLGSMSFPRTSIEYRRIK